MSSRRVSALAVLGAGAVAVGAFAAGSATGAVPANTIVAAEDQAPPLLNNILADGATVVGARIAIGNIFQYLWDGDFKGNYRPSLSASLPSGANVIQKGNKFAVILDIRPEAKWQDGKKVTSDDLIFTWKTIMDKNNQVAGRTGYDQIKSMKKLSATRVRVDFIKPYAPWRDIWCTCGGTFLLPKHVLQGKDFNTVWNNGGFDTATPYVGTGPFKLTSYKADESATLTRVPNYWDKKNSGGNVKTITYNLGLGTTTQAAQFSSGEANLIEPPPNFDLVNSIAAANPNAVVQSANAASWEFVAINTSVAPFNDKNVRQALAYALDRQGVVKSLLGGVVSRLDSQSFFPFQKGYYKPVMSKYTFQPEKAKALLVKAGYTIGSDGIATKGGQKLTVAWKTTSGNQARLKNIQFMATKARAAGFDLQYTPEPASKLFGGTLTDGQFQMAEFAFQGSTDPSVTTLFSTKQIPSDANGGAGQNYFRISDKTLDSLMDKADASVDVPTRQKLSKQIQDKLGDLVPTIPLYQRPNYLAAPKTTKGPKPNPTQSESYILSGTYKVGAS